VDAFLLFDGFGNQLARRVGGHGSPASQERQRDTWARAPRLDAVNVVRRLAEVTGTLLVVEGPCPGGQVGAAYVRWPNGRRSVLTMGSARTVPLVALARTAGLPVGGPRVLVRVAASSSQPDRAGG